MTMVHQRFFSLLSGIGAMLIFLLVLFNKMETDRQHLQFCELACQKYGEVCTQESCPFMEPSSSWVFSLALGASLVLAAGGLWLFFSQQHASKKRKEPKGLTAEEKQVYHLVKLLGANAYQSAIVEKSGLAKAKVSRVLTRLEAKQLIERKRKGMTNLIILK